MFIEGLPVLSTLLSTLHIHSFSYVSNPDYDWSHFWGGEKLSHFPCAGSEEWPGFELRLRPERERITNMRCETSIIRAHDVIWADMNHCLQKVEMHIRWNDVDSSDEEMLGEWGHSFWHLGTGLVWWSIVVLKGINWYYLSPDCLSDALWGFSQLWGRN